MGLACPATRFRLSLYAQEKEGKGEIAAKTESASLISKYSPLNKGDIPDPIAGPPGERWELALEGRLAVKWWPWWTAWPAVMSGGRGESGSAFTSPSPRPPPPPGCDGEEEDMLTCGMLKNQ